MKINLIKNGEGSCEGSKQYRQNDLKRFIAKLSTWGEFNRDNQERLKIWFKIGPK